MTDIPLQLSASSASFTADDERLTRTVYYTYEGQTIAFEIVNKGIPSKLDVDPGEVGPAPGSTFQRILQAICIPFRMRRGTSNP